MNFTKLPATVHIVRCEGYANRNDHNFAILLYTGHTCCRVCLHFRQAMQTSFTRELFSLFLNKYNENYRFKITDFENYAKGLFQKSLSSVTYIEIV